MTAFRRPHDGSNCFSRIHTSNPRRRRLRARLLSLPRILHRADQEPAHAPHLDPSVASGSSGNGKSFDGTGHSAFSFRAAEKNKHRTVKQACQEIVGRFGGGESTPVSAAVPKTNGRATRSQPATPTSNSKAYPLHHDRSAPLTTTCPAVSISPTLTQRSMQEGFCDGASQILRGSSRNKMPARKSYRQPRCALFDDLARVGYEKAQAIKDKMPQ